MKGSSIFTALSAAIFGFFIGISFPVEITPKLQYCAFLPCGDTNTNSSSSTSSENSNTMLKFWAPFAARSNTTSTAAPSNATISGNGTAADQEEEIVPRGEERLPPGIIVRESDLHLHRLWGNPRSDVGSEKKFLLTLTVGYTEKDHINATVHRFSRSDKFDIVLFHYDGRTTEWEEFEWSKQVVHVSARKQTKWWFAKRFLHPSIVAPYEYVFVWDEDLGVDNFTAPEEYVAIARNHSLAISQPALDNTRGKRSRYAATARRPHAGDMHTSAGFVEVMAPVFSRDAWTCVWHMIQNDLVHGWGLDHNFWRCVDVPQEQIGVVDAQFVVHRGVPTLISQGNGEQDGSSAKVRSRQFDEMHIFNRRMADAEKAQAEAGTADHHR